MNGCRYVRSGILLVTAVLLLLVNVGTITGDFAAWMMMWWPLGLAVYALCGFCPCKQCKVK